jgi:hypothetical protein
MSFLRDNVFLSHNFVSTVSRQFSFCLGDDLDDDLDDDRDDDTQV